MTPRRSRLTIFLTLTMLVIPAAWAALLAAPGDEGATAGARNAPAWKPEELEGLLAPVALYPDPLLGQVLVAATYPLELVEARQWLKKHPDLKGKELTRAAARKDWDASVQALVAFPEVLDRLTENVRWTTDLGNAFLEQEKDVMDAVQRLRREARESGKLKSTREQNVTTRVVETERVIEIVPADPKIIYVPVYNPALIWGEPACYGYPALYYPARLTAADLWVGFGVGVTLGALFSDWDYWYCGFPGWGWSWGWGWPYWGWGGSFCWNWGYGWGWGHGWHSWGWGCGWGRHAGVYCNGGFHHRYGYGYGRHSYGHGSNGHWQHNSYHRGSVPYRSQDMTRRYGENGGRSPYTRNNTRGGYERGAYARGGSERGAYARGDSGNRAAYARGASGNSRSTYADRATYARGNSDRGRSTYGDRASYAGGNRSSYTRGSDYGSRSYTSGRSVSGSSSYGSRSGYGTRSFSNGSPYGSRSSGGYSRGSSSSGSNAGGRYSGGFSGGRSYSGGYSRGGPSSGSYSGGRSSGGFSGGRSFSGGGFSGGRSGGGSFSGGRSGGGSFSGGRSGGGSFSGGRSGGSHRR